MLGCRPLTDDEVKTVLKSFTGSFATRNLALFVTGIKTGYRISELLSMRIGDVIQHGKVVDRVTVAAKNMKGRETSRTVLLHPDAKRAIGSWVEELSTRRPTTPQTYLFPSQIGVNRHVSRSQAAKILKDCFDPNGIGGKLGTHCLRKTFADKMYDLLGHDLVKTQRAMSHKNVNSTIKYLSFREEDIDDAILAT